MFLTDRRDRPNAHAGVLTFDVDAYAKPGERSVGEHRPRIEHVSPGEARRMTRTQRQLQKRQVSAERRAIKKSARRHLQRELQRELDERKTDR